VDVGLKLCRTVTHWD